MNFKTLSSFTTEVMICKSYKWALSHKNLIKIGLITIQILKNDVAGLDELKIIQINL